ncbi:MAG: hypothetical protein MUE65_01180 [Methanomassiliicoccales archaeon]|jgi:hypothetical protein|nr:hypothetical protein [Methanomassiliicoccales archaeon]
MMKPLDNQGLEGLPLKLLITSLVIALSIPAMNGAVCYLSYSKDLSIALGIAEDIRGAATSAFIGGPGNVRNVEIDLPAGCPASIMVGAAPEDPFGQLIEVMWKGEVAATVELCDPCFRIVTSQGVRLEIGGSTALRLACLDLGDELVVGLEVI